MSGKLIAARAVAEIGTQYRLRGRRAGVALDCVGLVLHALGEFADPELGKIGYRMRGDYHALIRKAFEAMPFCRFGSDTTPTCGDILLVSPASLQLHLLVFARNGFVHAHAALGRVVFCPGIPEWPLLDLWRLKVE